MCKIQTKLIKKEIKARSDRYYKKNKDMCVKHNFFVRCEVFIKFHKKVYPDLTRNELMEFIRKTKMPKKYWKNKRLW